MLLRTVAPVQHPRHRQIVDILRAPAHLGHAFFAQRRLADDPFLPQSRSHSGPNAVRENFLMLLRTLILPKQVTRRALFFLYKNTRLCESGERWF
jgi:hypothetical protein